MEIEDKRERERKMTKVCTVPFYQRHLVLFSHFSFFSSFYLLRLRSAYTMSRLDDDFVIQFVQGTFDHSIKIARFK